MQDIEYTHQQDAAVGSSYHQRGRRVVQAMPTILGSMRAFRLPASLMQFSFTKASTDARQRLHDAFPRDLELIGQGKSSRTNKIWDTRETCFSFLHSAT